MNGDELRVPSQRTDGPEDTRSGEHTRTHDPGDEHPTTDQADDGRAHDLQTHDVQTDDIPTHDLQTHDVQTHGIPTHDVRDPYGDKLVASQAEADETPAHAAPQSTVLFDQDPAQVQARWRELQTAFVDDPGEAVQRADGLVGEVVEAFTSSLTTRTGELRERWKGAETTDTEQLRLALRDYRGVLERLLALCGPEAR
ncbi:hypothetical protein ABT294_26950 [Nonomuraea sp. NPDC000554]|uniref:hypothetical protein n=1 Tax=Nonomuraea sp. NPDC000554 TaxID=3154259 RepID=UPI00331D4838